MNESMRYQMSTWVAAQKDRERARAARFTYLGLDFVAVAGVDKDGEPVEGRFAFFGSKFAHTIDQIKDAVNRMVSAGIWAKPS